MTMTVAYGAWPSPVTAELVAGAVTRLDQVMVSETGIYWLESRPAEGGRQVVVHHDGNTRDATPAEFNVRTLAHEYGGGDYTVHGRTVFCVNLADQRLYRVDTAAIRPITPEPALSRGDRYADMDVTPDGQRIYCVRERHRRQGQPENTLVFLEEVGFGYDCLVEF